MKIIIGLGNPGSQYVNTRHNVGFRVVEKLSNNAGVSLKSSPHAKGLFAEAQLEEETVLLFLPLTYMNNSGVAVKRMVEVHAIDYTDILVVCDDFSIDFGRLRIRSKGRDGGHNGLASIIYQLNSDEFPRLRLGIGAPPGKKNAADFVLEEFSNQEKEEVEFLTNDAADCCCVWLRDGIEKAMDRFNKKPL